jgi:hypothetical protein
MYDQPEPASFEAVRLCEELDALLVFAATAGDGRELVAVMDDVYRGVRDGERRGMQRDAPTVTSPPSTSTRRVTP